MGFPVFRKPYAYYKGLILWQRKEIITRSLNSKDRNGSRNKKAFRTTAKKYHPDMHPGDKECEEKFKEAQEAYAVLSDPEKRRQYDQFGHAAFDGGAGGAGGFDFSGMDMGDIFWRYFRRLFRWRKTKQ